MQWISSIKYNFHYCYSLIKANEINNIRKFHNAKCKLGRYFAGSIQLCEQGKDRDPKAVLLPFGWNWIEPVTLLTSQNIACTNALKNEGVNKERKE